MLLLRKPAASARQLDQSRGGTPVAHSLLALVLCDALEHVWQTHGIRVEHRAATGARETIAIAPDHVDVGRAARDALVEDPRSLVDQRVDAALDDLGIGKRTLGDAEPRGLRLDQRGDLRIVCALL